MAELGDMWFDCPVCAERITVPVRQPATDRLSIILTVNLGVIREHFNIAHPDLATQVGEAVTGDEPPEPGELRGSRR